MRVLLLEDDLNLCGTIEEALGKESYSVDSCHDGETAMLYALNTDLGYELAIVDRMLPIIDGLTIIKSMRRKGINIPVIIITGMSALDDRIDGLDGGADDYLVKPFHVRELLARVRALTRRPYEMKETNILTYADLTFDRVNRLLQKGSQSLTLTAKETELLYSLMRTPETQLTKEQLILRVWGADSNIEPGNVENYISFLRKRLKELQSQCEIKTVYGSGYKLERSHA